MSDPVIHLYNSLSRKKEEFEPVNPPHVGLYACGPTVYDFQHIGNLRTATLMDITKRILKLFGYDVKTVMNVTDVEDKIENRARERGVTVDEITSKYEKIYLSHLKKLNIWADEYPHASGHIKEQIDIIQELEKKGFTYVTDYGVYFDVKKDPDYGKLGDTYRSDKSNHSRIKNTEQKHNPEDFVLWRIPQEGEERQKLWDSPWGKGYPGWHIECSAMSMKHLTHAFDKNHLDTDKFTTIDIHIGGADLKEVHHENEIAQTESATDKPFIKYWMHGGMLNVGEDKMSKSLGNFYTLEEVIKRGFHPLALRYLYFTAHYRKTLTFTWEALESAQTSLVNLWKTGVKLKGVSGKEPPTKIAIEAWKEFLDALADDFNMPQAAAALLKGLTSVTSDSDRLFLMDNAEKVLGLDLLDGPEEFMDKRLMDQELPENIKAIKLSRDEMRKNKDWDGSDKLRKQLEDQGYEVEDTSNGTVVYKK